MIKIKVGIYYGIIVLDILIVIRSGQVEQRC